MAVREASKDVPKPDYSKYADLDAWELTTACLLVCDMSPTFRPPSPTGPHATTDPWFANPALKSSGFNFSPVVKLWGYALNAMKIDKLHAYEGDWTPMIFGNPPDLPVRIPPGASGHMSVRDPKAGVIIIFHDPWVCKDEFLAFAERKGYSIPEPLRGLRNTDATKEQAAPKKKRGRPVDRSEQTLGDRILSAKNSGTSWEEIVETFSLKLDVSHAKKIKAGKGKTYDKDTLKAEAQRLCKAATMRATRRAQNPRQEF